LLTDEVRARAGALAELHPELREMLDCEVPGRFTIVSHTIDALRRQVLLDLPDIDSKYDDHIAVTRRMLRHMLYPLWIQSVEKYADLRPQELLAAVSEGNDPANFIFCLNKADHLSERDADELRKDYSNRLARALKLPTPPQVYLISATHPDRFDLPALRQRLAREKPTSSIRDSLDLAERRQDQSLLRWLGKQRLGERAEQLVRLERDAEELTATRLALPVRAAARFALVVLGCLGAFGRRAARLACHPGNALADQLFDRGDALGI